MLHSVALVRTDVSEELSTSIVRVTRISELGTTLAVISNRRREKRWFLQELRGLTSQKTAFFKCEYVLMCVIYIFLTFNFGCVYLFLYCCLKSEVPHPLVVAPSLFLYALNFFSCSKDYGDIT
jgi:hypothetical protein